MGPRCQLLQWSPYSSTKPFQEYSGGRLGRDVGNQSTAHISTTYWSLHQKEIREKNIRVSLLRTDVKQKMIKNNRLHLF